MVKCEITTSSIGIKILLSNLILQINETNFNLIKGILNDGFIEDKNNYFNEVYDEIINNHKFTGNYHDVKEYLINQCKNNDTYIKSKFSNNLITNDEEDNLNKRYLFDQVLLLPVKEILTNERWGNDRFGTNSISRPLDFDLSVNIDKYKEIEKFEIVFIIGQHFY
jgi:hypothetical protein